MKHPLTWFCMLFGIFIAFLFVRTTGWYKEVSNPKTFWTEQVARGTELLDSYRTDVRKCTEELERLRHSASQELWIRQKALEGMSRAEAIAHYNSYRENSTFVCQLFRDIIPGAVQDLETARAKLQQLNR